MTAKSAKKSRRRTTGKSSRQTGKQTALQLAGGLPASQAEFVRLYTEYFGNGAAAYRDSHPGCKSYRAACVGASQALRIPKVRAAVDAARAERWKRSEMKGDEALALIAGDARADIRDLFDDNGQLLNPRDWPDSVAASVEAVDVVSGKVKLAGKAIARRTILEQTGKIKSTGDALFGLAKLLAGNVDDAADA